MLVAITSTGNSLESNLDPNFGRCSYFAIYDTETRIVEFLSNPNKDAEEGAGTASVRFLSGRFVKKIVSGEFGIKIKPMLDSLRIQMILFQEPGARISKIITLLNQ
jgi:predicted Fe-Mo cluster-binding NifX family protein